MVVPPVADRGRNDAVQYADIRSRSAACIVPTGPLASALRRAHPAAVAMRDRRPPPRATTRGHESRQEEPWFDARAASSGWPSIGALGLAGSAAADVKIAFIDPLSGGAASTGILAQKTHQFYIDAINAAGGINGEKIQLLSFDNKVNPQESLIQLKKALDDGARFVVQGNGSAVALAITEAVQKHNERNPGQGSAVPELRRRRSRAHQREVQLLALPLRRRRRHEDGGDDRRHRQGAPRSRRSTSSTRTTRSARRSPRRRARCSTRSVPTSRSSATSCIRCRRCRTSRRTSRRSRRPAPTRSSPATGATTWCS